MKWRRRIMHLLHDRYAVGDKLGEGGMGVVYRATDTRLGRPVALKVVHEQLADSAAARQRLVREAQVAASLNHPNICTIYEVFEPDAADAGRTGAGLLGPGPIIVLELVDGETLHARIARAGRLPLRELSDIAVQIADGLAEAHTQRIVHRDLKPQNVLITRTGRVKILDFGLARAFPHAAGPDAATVRMDTITDDRGAAAAVKGTVPYMSPEQATGRQLDARSDIFSFGIMLYEMAGGRRPFRGDTSVEVLARILEAEPPSLSGLNPELPPALERIVQRCLRKNPDERYHDTRDLLADLREVQEAQRTTSGSRQPADVTPAAPSRISGKWLAGAAAVALLAGTGIVYWLIKGPAAPAPAATVPAHKQISYVGDASFPAISPDGSFLAYVRGEPWGRGSRTLEPLAAQEIVLQDLAAGGPPIVIAKCRPCLSLTWSPDGTTLLASDDQQIMHIRRLGGTVRRFPGGAYVAWSPDGREIANASSGGSAVRFQNLTGEEVRRVPLTWPGAAIRALHWSPGGKRLAIVSSAPEGRHGIWLVSPDGTTQEKVFEDAGSVGAIKWAPTGDALYFMRGAGETFDLWRVPLAGETGPAAGPAAALMTGTMAGPNFTVDREGGRLLYTREAHYSNLWLAAVDPAGRRSPVRQLTTGTSRDQFPAVSPDGRRIAFVRGEGTTSNLHVVPIEGGVPQPLTSQMSVVGAPAWSPDGQTIAFCAKSSRGNSLWSVEPAAGQVKALAGTECTTTTSEVPVMWWPGRGILYQRSGNRNYSIFNPGTSSDWKLVADESVGWIFGPRVSPDGSSLAAFWNHKGGRGVWLIPADGTPPSLLLKAFGWPLGWSADGRSIYVYLHAPATDIVTIGRSGGQPAVLREFRGQRISLVPALTPDRRTVIYSSYAIQSEVWLLQNFGRR